MNFLKHVSFASDSIYLCGNTFFHVNKVKNYIRSVKTNLIASQIWKQINQFSTAPCYSRPYNASQKSRTKNECFPLFFHRPSSASPIDYHSSFHHDNL